MAIMKRSLPFNNRRSAYEILFMILKSAIGGKKKTHIMYEVNLSGTQLNKYLPWLVEKDLLINGDELYSPSSTGLLALHHLDEALQLMNEGGLDAGS